SELRTIKGGPGGGSSSGYGYLPVAEFTSSVLDTGSATTQYYTIDPGVSLQTNATIKFQVRSSDVATMTGSSWMGPDGTAVSYFTSQEAAVLPSLLNNKRFLQYKVFFTSEDGIHTSTLNDIEFTYQK
ncbi:MAG: hypothetical protein ACOYT9_00745, partial [Patescibacteria group bacterium]